MLANLKDKFRDIVPTDLMDNVIPDDLPNRLKAWWDGIDYEPRVIQETFDEEESEQETAEVGANLDREAEELRTRRRFEILLSQWLWGQGNMAPGLSEEHFSLIDFLTLSKEHSAAFIGTGLAASPRAVSKHCDTWISGYEHRKWLIPTALEQCKMQGLARKVTIEPFTPEKFALPAKKFNAIISLESLHSYPDPERMFQQIAVGLRPRGLMLLTDFIVAEGVEDFDHASCMFNDESDLKFQTRKDIIGEIQKFGMGVRNSRDVTEFYLPLIKDGWKRWRVASNRLKKKHGDDIEPILNGLLAEHARVWANRIEALSDDRLQVYAFQAEKSS